MSVTATIMPNPKAAVVYYIRGLVFSRLGLWPNSSDDFAVASRLDSSFRRGLADYSLGWALMAQGHYSDAIVSFTKAIARSPLPAPSYFQRSRAYEQLGDIDAAISDMNAVIRSIPKYPEAYHRRAHLFMRKRVHGVALNDLTAAVTNDPDDRFAGEDSVYLCGSRVSDQQCRLRLDPTIPPAADHPRHFEFAH